MKKRVVITGMGVIAPKSLNVNSFWETLVSGKSTADKIEKFDVSDFTTQFACEVKDYNALDYFSKKEIRKKDRYTQFALVSGEEAVNMAGLTEGNFDPDRAGIILGSGIGGIETLENQVLTLNKKGPKRVSPFVIPMFILNMVSGELAIKFNFKAPNFSVCSACSSATHAIGTAFKLIQDGKADIMLTGGSEAAITPIGLAGFCSMRALSTRNDEPQKASRPFDKERDGFVMSEGSGIIILETLESAQKRDVEILAELVGFGATDDAFHITAPSETAEGGAKCMQMALDDAGITPDKIDYINAHGTSTPYNDKLESLAIKNIFKEHAAKLKISSIKSTIGHLLGATGGVEAIASVLSIQKQQIPPTINYEIPDEECDLDYVPNQMIDHPINYVLSNSLGFGGHNGTIILKKFES